MTDNIEQIIKNHNRQLFENIVGFRRHIHHNPELSFNEFETAAYITGILQDNGIETDNSFGDNAVIGIIKGKNSGNNIALRADIDALPLTEQNDTPYTSRNKGVMHACGHDAHAASLLGTSLILNNLKDYINGNIILIFQPAEERNPGGAKILIEKGLLEKYNISKIVAQHVTPEVPTGHFCFGSGSLMASTDEIYITFSGTGGHAALPAQRSDSTLAIVDFITKANELQNELQITSPVIIAFGKITSDGAVNVIPPVASAEGTMRTFDEDIRNLIKTSLNKIAKEVASKHKCVSELEIRHGYPSLYNDPALSADILELARHFLDNGSIDEFKPRMTAEDFAYFSREIPGVLYRTGIEGNGFGKTGLHHPNFDIDETVFMISSGFMAYLAIKINH